ncbi:MAG: ATP-binding protein [bacterium]
MFINRDIQEAIKRYKAFPVVGFFGPRQSGKTTLSKKFFKNHKYLNFEDPEIRAYAAKNPKNFLLEYENEHGLILDEFQYVPEILSYIQIESDEKDRPGYFVLTGSQNFLMNEAVTQSLAGRIGILNLMPFSLNELMNSNLLDKNINNQIFQGFYPRIYAKQILPTDFYPSYIHSYIERDVRKLVNVENLDVFQRFMQMCAGRIGQLLNITDLAASCGISLKTVKSWLSILQASYIIFLLPPYFKNFSKRIVKTPKLYFYDTGLACSLLNIRSSQELLFSSFRGNLFENFIIADILKQYFNLGRRPPVYFWRDLNGRIEIDCLIDKALELVPVEIKSGERTNERYFDAIKQWYSITKNEIQNGSVVYTGELSMATKDGTYVSWFDSSKFVENLNKK